MIVAGLSAQREALANVIKDLMRTSKSVPNVEGWEPQTALMMGALYAVEAVTAANPEAVLSALGAEPIGNTFKDGQLHVQWRIDIPIKETTDG